MNKHLPDQSKPIRYGNTFPWAGILAGLKRMIVYSFLVVCLLVVLGITRLFVAEFFVDNEPIGDYF